MPLRYYTTQIPEQVLNRLCIMRERASSTWCCIPEYAQLVSPYVLNGQYDPMTPCVVREVMRQMDDHLLLGGGQ